MQEQVLVTVNLVQLATAIQELIKVIVIATQELEVAPALAGPQLTVTVNLEPQPPARAMHEQFVIVIVELLASATQLEVRFVLQEMLARAMHEQILVIVN